MKLAKKMLVSALALAMVAALALTAFAAPTIVMSATDAVVGKEVTITLSANEMVGLESADLVFTYDTDLFDFVSVSKAEGAGYDMLAGNEIADGTVTASFIYQENAVADTPLVTLVLKVVKAGEGVVSVAVNSWDGTAEPAVDTSITIKAVEPAPESTTAEPTTAETTTAEPTEAGSETTTAPKTEIPKTGEAGVAIIAGVMAVAAVAFVATRKKDEQ